MGREAGVALGDEVDGDDVRAAALHLEREVAVRAADVERAQAAHVRGEAEGVEDRQLHAVRVVAGRDDARRELDLVPPASMLVDEMLDFGGVGDHGGSLYEATRPAAHGISTAASDFGPPSGNPRYVIQGEAFE